MYPPCVIGMFPTTCKLKEINGQLPKLKTSSLRHVPQWIGQAGPDGELLFFTHASVGSQSLSLLPQCHLPLPPLYDDLEDYAQILAV
jgi:hypothetical protein